MQKLTPFHAIRSCAVFLSITCVTAVSADPGKLILIPAGTFEMGSPVHEKDRFNDEVLHTVILSNRFYLGETEVSWTLWNKVRDWALVNGYRELSVGNNGFNGPENEDHPVVAVTWWDAIQWCNARSEMEGLTPVYYRSNRFTPENVIRNGMPTVYANTLASGYRLPTEAEWEYAYRAGTRSAYAMGSGDEDSFNQSGWHRMNSERNTHPCGDKPPNPRGLRDMHGNAWEWCWDWYGDYPKGEVKDPRGPSSGTARILRGGSWMNPPSHARSAYRHHLAPSTVFYTIGFRIARNG